MELREDEDYDDRSEFYHEVSRLLLEEGDLDHAEQIARLIEASSSMLEKYQLIAEIGAAYSERGQQERGVHLVDEAAVSLRRLGEDSDWQEDSEWSKAIDWQRAEALLNLGRISWRMAEHKSGFELMREAADLAVQCQEYCRSAENVQDLLDVSSVLRKCAETLAEFGHRDTAFELAHCIAVKSRRDRALARLNQGS